MADKPATANVPAVKEKAKSMAQSVKFDASFFVGCLLGAALMHYGPGLISKIKPAQAAPKG